MNRVRAGDPEAFTELFRRYQPGVMNYILRVSGGNVPLAEDVAQQVFLSFWVHRNEYDLDKPLTPLLLTMARNAWLNSAKREGFRRAASLEETASSPAALPTPRDRSLEQQELQGVLERALSRLDPGVREVFILSRYHEMKYAEIAQILGISIKTVEARLSRALKELQHHLKDFLQ
jgi:RNA polymerase sigma-70 factor (ECF subfamily)